MRDAVARGFLILAYDRIALMVGLSLLRAAPWLVLGLALTYSSWAGDRAGLWLLAAIALAGLLLAPMSGGAAHLAGLRLARGESPDWRGCLTDARPFYGVLLIGTLGQALLLLAIARNLDAYLSIAPGSRDFMLHLGLASGFWIWALLRFWSFTALPLLLGRECGPREALRLATLLILSSPGRLLSHFLLRQALGLLMVFSGLGLFLGLGGLLPLHAAIVTRELLRPHGRDLVVRGQAEDNLPLELPTTLKKFWRPWD
jgi:hypothetical protein